MSADESLAARESPPGSSSEDEGEFDWNKRHEFLTMNQTIPVFAKASLLLDFLQDHQDLFKFTIRGELIYDGEVIQDSNLKHLVQKFSRNSKGDVAGTAEFGALLKHAGAPAHLFGSAQRYGKYVKKSPVEKVKGLLKSFTPKRLAQGEQPGASGHTFSPPVTHSKHNKSGQQKGEGIRIYRW